MNKLIHRYMSERLMLDYCFDHSLERCYINSISDEKYVTLINNCFKNKFVCTGLV